MTARTAEYQNILKPLLADLVCQIVFRCVSISIAPSVPHILIFLTIIPSELIHIAWTFELSYICTVTEPTENAGYPPDIRRMES